MKPIILLLISFLCYPLKLSSQIKTGFGGEVGLYNSDYGSFMNHTSLTYNWLISKSFSASLGVLMLYCKTDELSSWETQEVIYSFDDENIVRFNVLSSVTYTLPILKKTGVYGSASIFFQPVPLGWVNLEKSTRTDPISVSKGKYAFTRFGPGIFTDFGFYHDIVKNDHVLKLFLGFGYGWYDPLPDYRNSKIDGQDLSTRIPDTKFLFRITFRIMGF